DHRQKSQTALQRPPARIRRHEPQARHRKTLARQIRERRPSKRNNHTPRPRKQIAALLRRQARANAQGTSRKIQARTHKARESRGQHQRQTARERTNRAIPDRAPKERPTLMLWNLFSVYDNKARAWLPPWVTHNHDTARRIFAESLLDPNHSFAKNSDDY